MDRINPDRIRQNLQAFNFKNLFVEELGWEKPRASSAHIPNINAREVAHLGSIPALEISAADFPNSAARKKIHTDVSRIYHENLLIFVDEKRTRALWSWVKREGGKNIVREHHYVKGQPGDLFLSKLAGLFVDIGEYDTSGKFSVLEAGKKLKQALDVSKVTKRFYGDFKKVHLDLVGKLGGIDTDAEKRWYASVLLNRLMFVYFLQQKGFLDGGDYKYLENRFAQFEKGNIFEDFLKPLFFKAFALPDKHPEKVAARNVFGTICYLNGGLFLPHALEQKYNITLDNAGALNILGLFQSVTWYLNDVPGADDEAMSPDVLGYIFEKYINDQKSAGAYYTPPELTEYLCERTIHDLLVERFSVMRDGKPTRYESMGDILLDLDADSCRVLLGQLEGLRLLDPAVGSGAFLVAALKTLTDIYGALWGRAEVLHDDALKLLLIGDANRHRSPFYAIRKRIITQNLYGVDLMAESTEIARLRLFLSLVASAKTVEELEPLPNIDFNILAGNSLIGMHEVEAKNFIGGGLFVKEKFDELTQAKHNRIERFKQSQNDDKIELSHLKEEADAMREELKELCDAALWEEFVDLKIKYEEAQPSGKAIKKPLEAAHVRALQPFHWGYEFSDAMDSGGFDAIITNPPWEIWKPNAKEFFQTYSDVVTKKKMTIKDFEAHQQELLADEETAAAWREYLSNFPHVSEYFRKHAGYENQISVVNGKKAGTDINLYKLFTERCFHLLRDGGRCGIVIPSGIYTDLGAKQLREMLFGQSKVSGLFCFENRKEIFEGVHRSFKFVALSFRKGGSTVEFPAAFMRHEVSELEQFPNRDSLHIGVELVRRLSPDSLSVMEFKSAKDVEIAEKMLRFPPLGEKLEGVWNLKLTNEFHMTNDSHLFHVSDGKGFVPLYEGKMIWQFSHQLAQPRYWVNQKDGRKALLGRTGDTGQAMNYQGYRLAHRSIASSTNERTMVSSILPPETFYAHSLNSSVSLEPLPALFLTAVLNSYSFDYYLRQMVTGNLTMFFIYQMPVPRLTKSDAAFAPIVTRAAQLICTTPEFDELAQSAGIGSHRNGVTDAAQRAILRAELDALVAQLYGLDEGEFTHILGTFPLVPEPTKLAARNKFRDLERGVLRV